MLIYTANLGNFEKTQDNVEQELPEGIERIDYWRCTDEDFPPRFNSMTPRLQARIVKMFGWQMKPDYDFYLWVDSSMRLSRPDSARWFMEQLGSADIAAFEHNKRKTIQEEADYLKKRLELEKEGRKQPYVLPRYENEDIDGALSEVDSADPLFATTALIYRSPKESYNNNDQAFYRWWYLASRYHSIDQLGFTDAFTDCAWDNEYGGGADRWINLETIHMDYLKCPYLERNR